MSKDNRVGKVVKAGRAAKAGRVADKRKGFTLIELLVAISVLAIVAVLGWRGLDSIVRARVALSADLDQTRGLQLAFAQLQSDCAHIAPAAALGGRPSLIADQERIIMVRTVVLDDQPSRLEVISYSVKNGVLVRRELPATRDLSKLDSEWQAVTSDIETGQSVVLQAGVTQMSVRSWDSGAQNWLSGVAVPSLSPMRANPLQPAGVTGLEVALYLRGSESAMVKVFLLGAA